MKQRGGMRFGIVDGRNLTVGTSDLAVVVQWADIPDLIAVAVGAFLLGDGKLEALVRGLLFGVPNGKEPTDG